MLVVHAADLAAPALQLISRWAHRNRLECAEQHPFVAWHAPRWTRVQSDQTLHLADAGGRAEAGRQTCEWQGATSGSNPETGSFTRILVEHGRLSVTRSLYRGTDLFRIELAGRPVVSTELALLVALLDGFGRQHLNLGYCHDFLTSNSRFDHQTVFLGIHQVLLGERLVLAPRNAVEAEFHDRPVPPRADLIDTLTNTLCSATEPFKEAVLMFSGGLDSSVLLWALLESGVKVTALHTESTSDAHDSEYEQARAVAAGLGCRVTRIAPEPEDYGYAFSVPDLPRIQSPYDVPLGEPPFGNAPATVSDGGALVITGHGGDHVFVQNPGPNVCFSALRRGRFGDCLRIAYKLSRLKGQPASHILMQNLRLLKHEQTQAGPLPAWLPADPWHHTGGAHYLLRGLDPRTAKHAHLQAILLALQTCPAAPAARAVLAPLLLPSILGHVIGTPVEDMFSVTHDRTMLREAIGQRSGAPFAWRRTKRSSSPYLFRLVSAGQDNLLRVCCRPPLLRALNIDEAGLRSEIRYSGTVALSRHCAHILNLFKLQAFLCVLERQSQRIAAS